jgi:hypothetical protein
LNGHVCTFVYIHVVCSTYMYSPCTLPTAPVSKMPGQARQGFTQPHCTYLNIRTYPFSTTGTRVPSMSSSTGIPVKLNTEFSINQVYGTNTWVCRVMCILYTGGTHTHYELTTIIIQNYPVSLVFSTSSFSFQDCSNNFCPCRFDVPSTHRPILFPIF